MRVFRQNDYSTESLPVIVESPSFSELFCRKMILSDMQSNEFIGEFTDPLISRAVPLRDHRGAARPLALENTLVWV